MDKLNDLNNKYNINILKEIIVSEGNSAIYIIEGLDNIFSRKMSPVLGSLRGLGLNTKIFNLDTLLTYLNKHSQVCEVIGYTEYIKKIKNRINFNDTESVYLPLTYQNSSIYLRLKFIKLYKRNICILNFSIDIEAERTTESLYQYSYRDSLTGLFNSNTCYKHLGQIDNQVEHYIGFIDIDNFKDINDTLGHLEGDSILFEVGKHFTEISDEHIIFYHRSGDEFIFLTRELSKDEVESRINQIITCTCNRFIKAVTITSSCGFVKYNETLTPTAEEMILFADIAMYKAKTTKKGSYKYLDEDEIRQIINDGALQTLELLRKIR